MTTLLEAVTRETITRRRELFALFEHAPPPDFRFLRAKGARKKIMESWSRRPVPHPLVTLADTYSTAASVHAHAKPGESQAQTARRWARNRRKHVGAVWA